MNQTKPTRFKLSDLALGAGAGAALAVSNGPATGAAIGAALALVFGLLGPRTGCGE